MRDKEKGKEEEGLLKYNQKEGSCMVKKIGKLDNKSTLQIRTKVQVLRSINVKLSLSIC